jgi:hypothetical protein
MDRFKKLAETNAPKILQWLESRGVTENLNHVFTEKTWKLWDCVPLDPTGGLQIQLYPGDYSMGMPKTERVFHVSDVRLLEPDERPSKKLHCGWERIRGSSTVDEDGDEE